MVSPPFANGFREPFPTIGWKMRVLQHSLHSSVYHFPGLFPFSLGSFVTQSRFYLLVSLDKSYYYSRLAIAYIFTFSSSSFWKLGQAKNGRLLFHACHDRNLQSDCRFVWRHWFFLLSTFTLCKCNKVYSHHHTLQLTDELNLCLWFVNGFWFWHPQNQNATDEFFNLNRSMRPK